LFCDQVQKLNTLNNFLASGNYTDFWREYDGDDDMADLVADITGFEDLMRLRIVVAVSQAWREIQREVLEEWLNLEDSEFDHLMGVVGFKIDGEVVKVPLNKENEAKGTVIRENVKFERKWLPPFQGISYANQPRRIFKSHSKSL
jgi:translation initiation factor 3 subunit K